MTKPTLNLLGGIAVTDLAPAATYKLLAQTKVVGLLSYLGLAPTGRYQRRDRMVGLLWPELDQTHARAALRKAALAVRKTFGKSALLGRGDEELLLDSAHVQCDAQLFVQACEAGHAARALELYRGELMPGFHMNGCAEFGSWLDGQRTTLAQHASAAAWTLALRLEAAEKRTDAARKARLVVHYDWSDERVLRRTMQMLVRLGDRAGALRVFESCARRMRAELDTEPSQETRDLATAIRKGGAP